VKLKAESRCTICLEPFQANCSITILGCHKEHFFHQECAHNWIAYKLKDHAIAECPICRKEIS
jgi:uncharacterized Zn ribbon protein